MRPKPRLSQVISSQQLSPHLQRIVLGGDELSGFPVGHDGAHVKVLFPHAGERLPELDLFSDRPALKRSYTIRQFDPELNQLTLDFVINRHRGPATDWALNAKVGDYVGIAGPGIRKLTDFHAASYLLVGDITAVNAVNGYAKYISPDASLLAVVNIPTRADIITMDAGSHLKVNWHISDEDPLPLADYLLNICPSLPYDTQVFLGLEASELRAVKSVLLDELQLNRLNIHATGYWKQGMDADRFGADKKRNPL